MWTMITSSAPSAGMKLLVLSFAGCPVMESEITAPALQLHPNFHLVLFLYPKQLRPL